MRPLKEISSPRSNILQNGGRPDNILIQAHNSTRSASENHLKPRKLQPVSPLIQHPTHNVKFQLQQPDSADAILKIKNNQKASAAVGRHNGFLSPQLPVKSILKANASVDLVNGIGDKSIMKTDGSIMASRPKKHALFNGKHVEKQVLEQASKFRNQVNYDPYAEDENFKISFAQGYNSKFYALCVEMLANENDIYVLEGNFPGQYTEYLKALELPKAGTSNLSIQSRSPSDLGQLPSIERQSVTSKSVITQGSKLSSTRQPESVMNYSIISGDSMRSKVSEKFGGSRNLMLGKFFERKNIIPPDMPLENFVNSLVFNSGQAYSSEFFYIYTSNKYAKTGLGFAEIVFPGGGKKVGQLSKLYVARIQRKIKKAAYIYGKLIHMLFQTFKLERVSINTLANNHSQNEDLKALGFKLEKFIMSNNAKFVVLSLRKSDFYENSL